ncbi:MAG: NAD(P)H-hydrate dehydratase [Bacteroidota bacterium]
MYLSTAAQIREADRIMMAEKQFPGIILMETAGRKAAEAILDHYPDAPLYYVLAGPGNNGGDGLVIARMLHLKGKTVRLRLSHPPERFRGDAAVNWKIIQHLSLDWQVYQSGELASISLPAVVIDALLGTGIQSSVRPPIAGIIEEINTFSGPVVAIDLPSGLNADSGAIPSVAVQADLSLTFQCAKLCHAITPASEYCGLTKVLDIGIWPDVMASLGIKRYWQTYAPTLPERGHSSHKGTFGHMLLMAGSTDMGGAAALSALAAIRSGLGLLTVLCPQTCKHVIQSLVPEAMVVGLKGDHFSLEHLPIVRKHLDRKTAVAIGPGWGQHTDTAAFMKVLLPTLRMRLLIDADGLNLLAKEALWNQLPAECVLTPHPGEMKRLTGQDDIQSQRLQYAEALATQSGCTVVLKGAGTIISSPDGQSWVNASGNPGMATAGSGDVLSGMIGGLMAQPIPFVDAIRAGVWWHGRAGDLGREKFGAAALTATRIAGCIEMK